MTDNEKRAHDLAVSLVQPVMKERNYDLTFDSDMGISQLSPEVYETYDELYHALIEKIK